jgi:hypothetical protein
MGVFFNSSGATAFLFFTHAFVALLIFLEADILSIDVLSDMLQERSNSLSTIDALLCNC